LAAECSTLGWFRSYLWRHIMNESELLESHVRVRLTTARIFVEVRMHDEQETMAARWSLASTLPLKSTPLQVERARMLALADYRYFRVCDTCGDRFPAGAVRSCEDGTDICQECED
jgi:hypothetical protein